AAARAHGHRGGGRLPMSTTTDPETVAAELRPNWRKPYVVVKVSHPEAREAFARLLAAMPDHDFVDLANHPAAGPAVVRALVRHAAAVLTDNLRLHRLAILTNTRRLEY